VERDEIFTGNSHHELAFVGRFTTFSNLRWRTAANIEFRKMPIFPYWLKIFAHNLLQRCNTTMPDAHVTES